MSKNEYILMYKNDEVLSFDFSNKTNRIKVIKKLEHFDKAPYLVLHEENIDSALQRFFLLRSISSSRFDYKQILEATGSKTGLDLMFKNHGLSLSNHYWFRKKEENLRYEDINFFTNKWDDSFAKCVINRDYEGLKHCSTNVPDVTTPGWGLKGWICSKDGPKLYKLGLNDGHYEEALGEVVASRIARSLFGKKDVLKYDLEKIGDQYASVSSLMTSIDEELIPLNEIIDRESYYLYRNKNQDKENSTKFFEKIKNSKIPNLYEFFVKIACLKDLCFVSDLHFGNISIIRNTKTGEIRLAPIYDLGGAFGSSRSGQNFIATINKAAYLIVYYLYSDLDPNWDYSWFDPKSLDGYEEEIRKTLSLSNFYTPEIIDRIIDVYHHQKQTLEAMVLESKKRGITR